MRGQASNFYIWAYKLVIVQLIVLGVVEQDNLLRFFGFFGRDFNSEVGVSLYRLDYLCVSVFVDVDCWVADYIVLCFNGFLLDSVVGWSSSGKVCWEFCVLNYFFCGW